MHPSDDYLTRLFDRENPPHLDRSERSNTLSLKAIRSIFLENDSLFDGPRGHVAQGLLFLWNDHWKEAHEVAQADEGEPNHDYLHAIVHRREEDFSNSNYWFRNAGPHPSADSLATRLTQAWTEPDSGIDPALRFRILDAVLQKNLWNPSGFLKLVRDAQRGADLQTASMLRRIQAEEIIALYEAMTA